MAGLLLAAAPGMAQVFQTDFNSGVPAGSSLPAGPAGDPNEARINGGYLKLTDAINSSCGYFYVSDFAGGAAVNRFTATFSAHLFGSTCCNSGGRPADGFSFNLVPAATLNPNPPYIASELGLAEGLAVTFDTWDAVAPSIDGPNIQVVWLGQIIGTANIQPSQSPNGATTPEAAAKDVVISLHPDGKIDVTYGGVVAFHGLQTPYSAASIGVPAWVLTARTGGANDNHWIDNLKIVTQPKTVQLIAAQGSTWDYNDSTLTSANFHGTGWELPGYDVNGKTPAWKVGNALFGNDSAGIYDAAGQPFAGTPNAGFTTALNRGSSDRATFYFRTKFNWAGSAAGVTLNTRNWVDDGFIAYLNGVEVSRIRVPAGPVTWDTLGENPPTEGAVEVRTWDSASLVEGENVVAVEVHQSSLGSSDVAMAIELSAVGPLPPTITDPVEPTNRVVLANRPTTLVCDAIGSPAVTYQWYRNGQPVDGATSSTYAIAQMAQSDAGSYFCRVANSLGSVDTRTAVVEYNFDETGPVITQAAGLYPLDRVGIVFNELVDQGFELTDPFSYEISDGTLVQTVQPGADGRSVTLILTSPLQPDTDYTVKASNIKDLAGNVTAETLANFRTAFVSGCSGVIFETYNVSNRGSIDDLETAQPNFPNKPRERQIISAFDSRLAAGYEGDGNEDYAGRLRGYFIPPVSGNWIFHMRTDDPGRLYFNPTGPSSVGKVRVGEQTGCCNGFPAGPPQRSGPFALTAGNAYYVELLYREYGGGDYGQVAVALEGAPAPTAANLGGTWVGYGAAPVNVAGPVTIEQQPVDATILQNTMASFTVGVNDPGRPLCYQWRRNGVEIPGAYQATYSFGPVSLQDDNGAEFDCVISTAGASATTVKAKLTVFRDEIKPTVERVTATPNLTVLQVRFSELVEKAPESDPAGGSAQDEFNYTIPGNEVVDARLGADGRTVALKLRDALTPDTSYAVTISGVYDLAGNEMDSATINVRSLAIVPGFAAKELYQGIGGVLVSDLTGNAKYPGFSDLTRYGGLFELNTFDEFENYGARMSGYIMPPVSGAYNFFMSSDDGGSFWLSTDMNPANLVQVASEPVWNGRRDWLGTARRNAAAPENRSSTLFPSGIELTAGQMYYFEAFMKEGGGGDNLAVTWQMPGAPLPASGSSPLSGIYMATLADPSGASLRITQQPTDQVFVIANDTLANESFTSGDGGFTVETPDGAFNTPWVYDNGSGTWVVRQDGAEVGHPMTTILTSPEYSVTKAGGVTLTMKHRYSYEDDGTKWDGGQIQVSVNGAAFTAVPGSALSQAGYVGTVSSGSRSRLAGQESFTGTSAGHASGTYLTTVAALGNFTPGDKVRFRLFYAGDTNTRGAQAESWQIDSVLVNQGGGGAQAVTFAVAIEASKAGETTPTTFFQWMRDDGAGFKPVAGANGPSLTFTPILSDNGAKFKCQVYILGANATSDVANLRVATPNTPPRFTAGPNQAVDEDAGPQAVANWATDILHYTSSGGLQPARFDSLPVGSELGGNAAVSGGILHLTDAVNSQQSSFVTPASPVPVDSLVVSFKARIGGGTCCGDRTADGWSVTIGDVTVPVSFPVAAEEGAAVGNGFAVNFDSWDNGGLADDDAHTAPNVDVKVGGNVVAYQAFDGVREGGRAPSGPFINDPATGAPMSYKTGDAFTNVRIQLDADGTLDVEFKGVKVVNNVQTGLTLPLSNVRVAFGARTGGANDNHWIDDLLIVGSAAGTPVVVYPPQSAGIPEPGQTVHFLVENDNPSLFSAQPAVSPDGTLTYTPAPNANGIAHVSVRAQDNGGTEFGGDDTSDPQAFTITVRPVNDCPTLAGVPPIVVNSEPGASANGQLVGSDIDGDVLTYMITQPAAHGSLAVNANTGAFTYSPNAGYVGPDSFRAVARDGSCSSSEVTVSITVREVNRCPTAVAKIEPNVLLTPGQSETVVIAGCNTNACLHLDGTGSSDPDGDSLTYAWVIVHSDGSIVPLASGATATACLAPDNYTIRLIVDDGRCNRSADVAVQIITASEAVDALIEKVNNSNYSRNKRPLLASLKAAGASFERGSFNSAVGQLGAFINKCRAQIAKENPALAADLARLANAIIDSVNCLEDGQ